MNVNIQGYLDAVNAPWGQLFYKMIWHNLPFKEAKILDFGSGFGITADYLAKDNEVTAIEPNAEMISNRSREHSYDQIVGGIERLKDIPDMSFDVVVCHNVLEYMDERREVFREFDRVLKNDGVLSLVKHNKVGKIMQKAVFENDVDGALELINNKNAVSANFGMINEYGTGDLEEYIADLFWIDKVFGVRTFFGLQRNEYKTEPNWANDMFKLECAVEEMREFREIAFFHHIVLKKYQYGKGERAWTEN